MSQTLEIWVNIRGYGGDYQVSSLCRFKSFKHNKPRILKQTPDSSGHLMVGLSKNNKETKYMVHNLYAKYFIPNPNPRKLNQINHLDYNPQNNNIKNLEWCTHKRNMEHAAAKPGRRWAKNWKGKFGADHNTSKMVYQIDVNTGNVVNVFGSTMDAHRTLGIKPNHISEVATGRTNRSTAGGFIWKYAKIIKT